MPRHSWLIPHFSFLLLMPLVFGAMSYAPAAQANPGQDALRAGIAAFRDNQLVQARALFLDALSQGLDSAKLYYNLGVVNYRLGDYVQAEKYFARAAEFPESSQIAHYNLARCAERRGDRSTARRWYAKAMHGDEVRVAELARQARSRLTVARRGRLHSGFLLAGGFDSGVVGLVDQVTSLPTDIPDIYYEAAARVGFEKMPWYDGEWLGEVSVYTLGYDTVKAANVDSVGGRLNWGTDLVGGRNFVAHGLLNHEWLDAQPYQLRLGLELDYGALWRGGWFRYGIKAEWLNSQAAAAAEVEGLLLDLKASVLRRLGSGVGLMRVSVQHNDRRVPNKSPLRHGIEVYWRSPALGQWELGPGLQWRRSDYSAGSRAPERRLRALLRLETRLDTTWKSRTEFIYEHNRSADSARTYEHFRVVLNLIGKL